MSALTDQLWDIEGVMSLAEPTAADRASAVGAVQGTIAKFYEPEADVGWEPKPPTDDELEELAVWIEGKAVDPELKAAAAAEARGKKKG